MPPPLNTGAAADLQCYGRQQQHYASEHDPTGHDQPPAERMPFVRHGSQLATRTSVQRKVTAVVAHPSTFVLREFTRAPITSLRFVRSIMMSSNGGTEKPCTTPDQTSARIGLNPRKFIATASAV